MITSIVLTGPYNIGVANNKIRTPDDIIIDIKDIPFVRYRFQNYGENELKFITENKKKFPCVHLVEIALDSNTSELMDTLEELDDTIGKLIYIDIDDNAVANGLNDETLENIESIADYELDRISIRDKSTTLYPVALTKLKKQINNILDIGENEIGVCGGPCCFVDGNACLTAVKARELLARYSERDDVVVPSANHEGKVSNIGNISDCVNHCGCIRYHIFNSDVEAPASKSKGKKSTTSSKKSESKKNTNDTSEKKDTKPKKPKVKGFTIINW